MGNDPLKVEVKVRPQYVGDPCAVFLLRFDRPFCIFEQNRGAERRSIFNQRGQSSSFIAACAIERTTLRAPAAGPGEPDPGVFVIEHDLLMPPV